VSPPAWSRRPGWPLAGLALSIALVAAVTLVPNPGDLARHCPFLALECGQAITLDIVTNVVLFLPFGLCLRWTGRRPRAVFGGALLLSFLVELAQGPLVPGRDAALRDVLSNGAGGLAGAWSFEAARNVRAMGTRGLRMLGRTCAAGALGALTLGMVLLQGSLPEGVWYGQREPGGFEFERFTGSVIDARVGGYTLDWGPIENEGSPREWTPSDTAPLWTETISPRGPSRGWAPIVAVVDRKAVRIARLAQVGGNLVFEPRVKAEDWGLGGLSIRTTGSVVSNATDTLVVSASFVGGRLEVRHRSRHQLESETVSQQIGPITAWRTLVPFRWALQPATASLLDGVALALLFAPLGILCRLADRRSILSDSIVTVLVAALALSGLPWRLYPAHWASWLGVGVGWWLGFWIVARRARTTAVTGAR